MYFNAWAPTIGEQEVSSPLERRGSDFTTSLEIRALQPQRDVSLAPEFVLGLKDSGVVTFTARIYADTLPEPETRTLEIDWRDRAADRFGDRSPTRERHPDRGRASQVIAGREVRRLARTSRRVALLVALSGCRSEPTLSGGWRGTDARSGVVLDLTVRQTPGGSFTGSGTFRHPDDTTQPVTVVGAIASRSVSFDFDMGYHFQGDLRGRDSLVGRISAREPRCRFAGGRAYPTLMGQSSR